LTGVKIAKLAEYHLTVLGSCQETGGGRLMSDIKLFKIEGGTASEVSGSALQIEKSLQSAFEKNLEVLLGIKFLASEHATGPVHGGRIDTLGVDEDGCPVIIEYKRSVNENVINQGLFYLDWLLDHRKEFQWLVMEKLGSEVAKEIDWSAPRLICIAGDFTRYDEHAVKQIARNIELIRYRRFDGNLLLLELVRAPKQTKTAISSAIQEEESSESDGSETYLSQQISYRISQSDQTLRDLLEAVRQFLIALGDDVQMKELKYYIAFKRIKNFACVEVYPQAKVVTIHLKVDPQSVDLEDGFSRDVTNIGHFGTGDLQLTLKNMDDFSKAQPLLRKSYEGS
jgi:predicted transport protein